MNKNRRQNLHSRLRKLEKFLHFKAGRDQGSDPEEPDRGGHHSQMILISSKPEILSE
jgi:hypothetical protein